MYNRRSASGPAVSHDEWICGLRRQRVNNTTKLYIYALTEEEEEEKEGVRELPRYVCARAPT